MLIAGISLVSKYKGIALDLEEMSVDFGCLMHLHLLEFELVDIQDLKVVATHSYHFEGV